MRTMDLYVECPQKLQDYLWEFYENFEGYLWTILQDIKSCIKSCLIPGVVGSTTELDVTIAVYALGLLIIDTAL